MTETTNININYLYKQLQEFRQYTIQERLAALALDDYELNNKLYDIEKQFDNILYDIQQLQLLDK